MRQLKNFGILLIQTLLIFACGNHGRNVKNPSSDSVSVSGIEKLQNKPVLSPLEPGDIRITEDSFGTIINLTGEPLKIKENTKPEQLLLKDKYLITNNQRNDSVFMIFELPDFKCIAAFGVKGKGPGEFSFPRIVETDEDSVLFYIYELINEKVFKVTLKHLKPEYYLTLPKQNRSFADKQIVFINNATAYYSSSTAKGKEIYFYNRDSIPQAKTYKDLAIPGIKGSWTTLIGDFGINTKSGRIAYAYKYFKRIKIIDLQTIKERNIVFEARNLEKGLNDIATLEPTNITHYWGMSANDDYFWMLYSGRTPVDVYRDNQNKNKYIYVEKFDWNGNPVKKFKLDDWGYFCVDKKNEFLYLASTAGVNSLLRYNISDSSGSLH
jgi:hypothetical protein